MLLVGASSGAVSRSDPAAGALFLEGLGLPVVELSVLDEAELPLLEAFFESELPGLLSRFERLSVHAPAKNRLLPERELVSRLDVFGLDTVLHPEVALDLSLWGVLGPRLLLENNDSRKPWGQDVASLERLFDVVPEAGFCLDVSHALDVGGLPHALSLVEAFGDRLVQLHVGCGVGRFTSPVLEAELLAALPSVLAAHGRLVPLVLERTVALDAALVTAQVEQVRSACAGLDL